MNKRRARVAIVHPWMPQYRREFFDLLIDKAEAANIELKVMHGTPPPELAARGDSFLSPSYTALETRTFNVGPGLIWKNAKPIRREGPWDAVILEQAVRNLETYPFLFPGRKTKIAFWGHGRTYTKQVSGAQERIKEWLTLRTDWFFSYTAGGRDHLASLGYDRQRITVVNNSIDSVALKRDVDAIGTYASMQFREELNATGPIVTFIGGVDETKRIDFLLETIAFVWPIRPDVTFVIAGAGDGEQQTRLAAQSLPNLRKLPPVSGSRKALLLANSALLAIPGRVGLVAVDSFASGTPIVTTEWPWHAPEFEYLDPGVDSIVTENTVRAYAQAIVAAVADPVRLGDMSAAARAKQQRYSTEAMSDRFLSGVEAMMTLNL